MQTEINPAAVHDSGDIRTIETRTASEIADLGRAIYRDRIRGLVEPDHRGEFLVVDIDSGDYASSPDEDIALEQLEQLRPAGTFYLLQIGYAASLFMGARAA